MHVQILACLGYVLRRLESSSFFECSEEMISAASPLSQVVWETQRGREGTRSREMKRGARHRANDTRFVSGWGSRWSKQQGPFRRDPCSCLHPTSQDAEIHKQKTGDRRHQKQQFFDGNNNRKRHFRQENPEVTQLFVWDEVATKLCLKWGHGVL